MSHPFKYEWIFQHRTANHQQFFVVPRQRGSTIEARAFSMTALIFLCGHNVIIHDHSQLMFHAYSSSFFGKGNEQEAEVIAVGKWLEKVICRIFSPFSVMAKSQKISASHTTKVATAT